MSRRDALALTDRQPVAVQHAAAALPDAARSAFLVQVAAAASKQ
jgi:hypothetical protein